MSSTYCHFTRIAIFAISIVSLSIKGWGQPKSVPLKPNIPAIHQKTPPTFICYGVEEIAHWSLGWKAEKELVPVPSSFPAAGVKWTAVNTSKKLYKYERYEWYQPKNDNGPESEGYRKTWAKNETEAKLLGYLEKESKTIHNPALYSPWPEGKNWSRTKKLNGEWSERKNRKWIAQVGSKDKSMRVGSDKTYSDIRNLPGHWLNLHFLSAPHHLTKEYYSLKVALRSEHAEDNVQGGATFACYLDVVDDTPDTGPDIWWRDIICTLEAKDERGANYAYAIIDHPRGEWYGIYKVEPHGVVYEGSRRDTTNWTVGGEGPNAGSGALTLVIGVSTMGPYAQVEYSFPISY